MDRYDDPGEKREPVDIAGLLADLAANADTDPTPEQVSALFAVALSGEPPSTVSAASVLREVRAAETDRPARFLSAEWFSRSSGAWKWGGGLVAAAAVAGAIVLAVPQLGGSATDSAMSMPASAEAQADSALSAAADKAGGADARAGSDTAADGSQEAAPEAPAMAGALPDELMSAGTGGDMSAESAPQPSADSAGGTAPSAEAYSTASGGGAADSIDVTRPPLTDAEWAAAIGALPPGVAGQRWDQALRERGLPGSGSDVRGDHIGISNPELSIYVLAGPDTGPGTDYPGPSDGKDTVGNIAERLGNSGYVTVQVVNGTTRVAVAAPRAVLSFVPEAGLRAIADAVLAVS